MSKLEQFIEEKQVFARVKIEPNLYYNGDVIKVRDLRELGKTHVLVPREPRESHFLIVKAALEECNGKSKENAVKHILTCLFAAIDAGFRTRNDIEKEAMIQASE